REGRPIATSSRYRRRTACDPSRSSRDRFWGEIPTAMRYSRFFKAGEHLRGRSPPPQFRTIQIGPKELPTLLRQGEPAGERPQRMSRKSGNRFYDEDMRKEGPWSLLGGSKPRVRHAAARVRHIARRRGGGRACAALAARRPCTAGGDAGSGP